MRALDEEVFGPVAAVIEVDGEDEAVEVAKFELPQRFEKPVCELKGIYAPEGDVKRLSIALPAGEQLATARFAPVNFGRPALDVSPDGNWLVFWLDKCKAASIARMLLATGAVEILVDHPQVSNKSIDVYWTDTAPIVEASQL